MSVRGEIIYIYESCPVSVLIFRFRQSVAFLKSRIRWEREYLPYFSIRPISEQYCDYNNNDDELGLSRYLSCKVPSIHRSIKQYSGHQNDKTPLSSNPSEVAGPGQTTSSLTRTNKQTEQGSKQAKQHVQHQKKRKTTINWPAIHK